MSLLGGCKQRLQSAIESVLAATPQLYLTHITKLDNARSVFENGYIATTDCKVLEESLCYFFYGRAEYRGRGYKASDLDGERPVCFVIKNVDKNDIFSVFPFDTGAFYLKDGVQERYFPNVSDILDLSIGDDVESAQRLITKFWENNDNFINNKPMDDAQVQYDNFSEMEVGAYIQLLSKHGRDELDGRVSTPEIVALNDISLHQVEFIIAPSQISDSEAFRRNCDDYGIVPIYYYTMTPLKENEYISVIQDRFYELLRKNV